MRRAVHEARELKKELVLLRQEKEELRLAAQKSSSAAPGRESAGTSKQNSNKAIELKLRQKIQLLTTQNAELESSATRLHQQVSDLESQHEAAAVQLTTDLEGKDHEITSLREELRKAKLVADETKRKCQKMLKEKKDEAQRALQENEQLARCTKTLQGQLALLPQLKKQLEQAKAKRADMAEVWQNKLEKRGQAFLREEEASKQKLEETAAKIGELTNERENLQLRLEELERKLRDINADHQDELRHEAQRLAELESTMHQLQKKLLATEAATREAEQAEFVAKETQEQETRLRQLAEDAADAVEARAEKAERALAQAQTQLSRLEEALTARGVTLDYLLKQQEPIPVVSRTPSSDRITARARSRGPAMKAVPTASRDPVRSRTTAKPRMDSSRRKLKSNNDDEKR
ncbi:Laminin subunit alpha-5 [Phytophthora citrophthora]|uniref:Laminin subunit alpha-5 n=1 Tax=Phytophthora citrophthora TaxID=4793 RepID=A0AAD9LQ18_9STRA|nr:Laminin subunit alpha-5 [Phytophthora citrophthora]